VGTEGRMIRPGLILGWEDGLRKLEISQMAGRPLAQHRRYGPVAGRGENSEETRDCRPGQLVAGVGNKRWLGGHDAQSVFIDRINKFKSKIRVFMRYCHPLFWFLGLF
jgi:hypothetical protein